jgi:hypothetical protein
MMRSAAAEAMRRDETIRLQLDGRTAALPRLCAMSLGVCAISLSVALASIASAAAPAPRGIPGGCAHTPSWIAVATVQPEGQSPLASCFSASSSQAEAVLSIANNRPYGQLITVSGASLDLAESKFARPLEGALSTLLGNLRPAAGPSAFLVGPHQDVTLTIDRPAPGAAREIHIDPSGDNAFAVAAVIWRFLSAAAQRRLLPSATRNCVASMLNGALQRPPQPERALRRVHACVNAAPLPARAEARLRALASRLLRDAFFQSVIEREATEPHPVRIALYIAASNPELVNPAIHPGPLTLGTVPAGQRTVEHLSASGGVPPYRFYLAPEPGGPGVPGWLHLAADGTLILEPPLSGAVISVPVEVVDSTGEHSVVAN